MQIGIPREKLHILDVPDGERAFYSKKTYDIEYEFPFGVQELEGVAYRTDYDLGVHQKGAGKPLEYFRTRVVGMEEGRSAQAFNLTAEEKIAWDRARVDLEIVDPKLKKLSDAAIVEKAMDREWAADAIRKAKEKAAAFDEIAKRSRDRQAALQAQANRERMLDLADQLEEQLREPRPERRGGQGPKTIAHKRNQLAPKSQIQNKLIEGE